jgi:hypothetical protein
MIQFEKIDLTGCNVSRTRRSVNFKCSISLSRFRKIWNRNLLSQIHLEMPFTEATLPHNFQEEGRFTYNLEIFLDMSAAEIHHTHGHRSIVNQFFMLAFKNRS